MAHKIVSFFFSLLPFYHHVARIVVSLANKFYRQMWQLILNHTVQVIRGSYKEFNLKE